MVRQLSKIRLKVAKSGNFTSADRHYDNCRASSNIPKALLVRWHGLSPCFRFAFTRRRSKQAVVEMSAVIPRVESRIAPTIVIRTTM